MRLIRNEPDRNIHRWYVVGVQATLLEEWAVVCGWGSLRSGYERWRCIPCEDETHARQLAERIARRKIRRGYRFSAG
ncbi:MAG: hypothetical protein KatS3mg047_1512 [Bellilinea sp.]|nr:MAG: hypothetical protein KatS3mg047_1512 [Bellilinea sp.]